MIPQFIYKHSGSILLGACCVVSIALATLIYERQRSYLKDKAKKRRKRKTGLNIGGIFGMDVGGTLTKIVYFQPDEILNRLNSNKPESAGGDNYPDNSPTFRRSTSLTNLSEPQHQEALKQLYDNMSMLGNAPMTTLSRDPHLTFNSEVLRGSLHFMSFETRNILNAVNIVSATGGLAENIRTIGCTGGGAHKYACTFEEELDIKFDRFDEMQSLMKGMHFAVVHAAGECYTFRNYDDCAAEYVPCYGGGEILSAEANDISNRSPPPQTPSPSVSANSSQRTTHTREFARRVEIPYASLSASRSEFPYLVVNIGSGVSILKVSSPGTYTRVSGSSVGGGTYWGLCRLLTRCQTFAEVLDLAELGDAEKVDMLVRDIYGGDYGEMNLDGSMVASSFGKVVMKQNPREGIKEEDLAKALLLMITNNIGQVSFLNAKLHNCTKIFFVGSFLRLNTISCRRLAFAIDFWSQGVMEAIFLTHEGYFGALGSFIMTAFGDDADKFLYGSNHSDGNNNGATDADCGGDNNANILALQSSPKQQKYNSHEASSAAAAATKKTIYGIDADILSQIRNWCPIPLSPRASTEASDSGERLRDEGSSHTNPRGSNVDGPSSSQRHIKKIDTRVPTALRQGLGMDKGNLDGGSSLQRLIDVECRDPAVALLEAEGTSRTHSMPLNFTRSPASGKILSKSKNLSRFRSTSSEALSLGNSESGDYDDLVTGVSSGVSRGGGLNESASENDVGNNNLVEDYFIDGDASLLPPLTSSLSSTVGHSDGSEQEATVSL